MSRLISRGLAAVATAAALVLAGGATAAQAADEGAAPASTGDNMTISSSDLPQITESDIEGAFAELTASDLPRTTQVQLGGTVTTFDLNGVKLSFTTNASRGALDGVSRAVTPDLGGGWDTRGMYISFNSLDQQALIAGGAVALGAAICLIPAVGQIACAVVGVVLTVATVYVANHGICSKSRTLRVYPTSRTGRCV